MSAIPTAVQPLDRPADPAALVGTWVRAGDGRPDAVGVLVRVERLGRGFWSWELRTPAGPVRGSGSPALAPVTEADARGARRRLRAARADLAEFGVGTPGSEHAAEDLDLLELQAAACP